MLKEIDRDESHSLKKKIIRIIQIWIYTLAKHYKEPLFTEVVPTALHSHAPFFRCYIHHSFKREKSNIKLLVFREI
jgi:hypothetical protein